MFFNQILSKLLVLKQFSTYCFLFTEFIIYGYIFQVLIFSFFKTMLNLIEEFAQMRDYKYARLDGDDDIETRKVTIRTFNTDPEIFLFLITTRAGGLGLNLTSADTVIIFDSDYVSFAV